jgi:hypothetical protein
MVLGRIIAAVSGESSQAFINRRILQPLGMNDTVWNLEEVDPERLAKGHHWLNGAWVGEPMLPSGDVAAFGGLYSTVADLARWVRFMLAAWPPRDDADDAIARRAALREMQQPQRLFIPSNDLPSLWQPVTWSAEGYGYGLRINYAGNLCIVSHAGGLPGFGSHMCWLPDYDLGVIALGNVRNATMRAVATVALQELVRQGYARPRPVQPAPALTAAVEDVNRLLRTWDDALADHLFADNFFLDNSREWWRQETAKLAAAHGALRMDGPLKPENALRGTWKLAGERGWVNAHLTLAPTRPPRVQELGCESVLPPDTRLQAALDELTALLARPTRRGVQKLFAAQPDLPADRHSFYDQMRLLAALCGPCTLGEILAGDGESWVRLRIEGQKAAVIAELCFDADKRKFVRASFRQVH